MKRSLHLEESNFETLHACVFMAYFKQGTATEVHF